MPFALDSSPELSEISEAVNYLLANYVGNVSADPNTGQIIGPQGIVVAYLYRYLAVKYADSFDGSLNFSNSPTGRGYYGVSNSNSTTESTNPADYIWYKVAGGFGTTKFLFYQTIGGRSINFVVATTAPDDTYIQDSGVAIDLDVITASTKANSATTAYLVQSQSSPAPSGFPQYTSGSSLPLGWSSTLGTVSVGQVAWYSFGQYNGSTIAVNGIPANSTYWSTPVAASVFQDIRSDNWNGSTPPVSSNVSTWGTQGYYISQSTGDVYANSVFGRGVAYFRGNTTDAASTISAATFNDTYYSNNGLTAYSNVNSSLTAAIQAYNSSTSAGGNGVRAQTTATSSNAIWGQAFAGTSYGVRGDANYVGVYGQGTVGVAGFAVYASGNYGGYFTNTYPGGVGLWVDSGTFKFGGYTIAQPPGGTSSFLRADGSWAVPSGGGTSGAVYFGTNSGTATESSNTINIVGSTSTGIAGAYVGTSGSGNTVTLGVQTTSPSDVRLKEEIQDADVGLAFVKQLRPVSYKLKADPKHQKGYGFIAQEVEQLIGNGTSLVSFEPDWQVGDEVGFNTIHYPSYIAVLTKAIQELTAKVEELESKLKG